MERYSVIWESSFKTMPSSPLESRDPLWSLKWMWSPLAKGFESLDGFDRLRIEQGGCTRYPQWKFGLFASCPFRFQTGIRFSSSSIGVLREKFPGRTSQAKPVRFESDYDQSAKDLELFEFENFRNESELIVQPEETTEVICSISRTNPGMQYLIINIMKFKV